MSEAWESIELFMTRLMAFYPVDDAHRWLCRSHRMLGYEKPIDLIRAGRADEVDAVIYMLETGAYL